MSRLGSDVVSARESARRNDGRFGVQPTDEASAGLTALPASTAPASCTPLEHTKTVDGIEYRYLQRDGRQTGQVMAYDGNCRVGFLNWDRNDGLIENVFVLEGWRRRGIASFMLDHARQFERVEHSGVYTDDGRQWAGSQPDGKLSVVRRLAEQLPHSGRLTFVDGKTITDFDARLVRDRKAFAAFVDTLNADEAVMNTKSELAHWASRTHNPRVALVHDDNGSVIAHVVYEEDKSRYGRALIIHDLKTHPDARGHGAATALMNHLKYEASTRSHPTALMVVNMLRSAKSFYSRCGFDVSEHSSLAYCDLAANTQA